jgi:hypothetical protein
MDWKGIGKTVMKSAPLIGTILGGPAGGAVGSVVSMVGSALGLKPDETTPDAVSTILAQDKDALLKLKQLEADHKVELEKIALESDRMYLADTADARAREVAITQATGKRDALLVGLALILTVGFFGTLATMLSIEVPEGQSDVIYLLIGSLVTGFGTVMNYFFGSSKGSADKTAAIVSRGTGDGSRR